MLIVDRHGRTVFPIELPAVSNSKAYPKDPVASQGMSLVLIRDIDKDAKTEVVAGIFPRHDSSESGYWVCFNQDGTERWRFPSGREVRTATNDFPNKYRPRSVTLVPSRGAAPDRLLLINWQAMYPTQALLLDSGGKCLGEYWHSGLLALSDVFDVNGDSKDEIILAGINNAYDAATLMVLDPDNMHGASDESAHPAYQLLGFPPGTELARVILPRTCINKKLSESNQPHSMERTPGGFQLDITEAYENQTFVRVIYRFRRDLTLAETEYSDGMRELHRRLFLQGILDHRLTDAEEADMGKLVWLKTSPGIGPVDAHSNPAAAAEEREVFARSRWCGNTGCADGNSSTVLPPDGSPAGI